MKNLIDNINMPLFIIVSSFLLFISFKIKNSKASVTDEIHDIVKRDQDANFVPSKEVPEDFFIIPNKNLPFEDIVLNSGIKSTIERLRGEIEEIQNGELIKPILEEQNIDLKEKYGVSSFEHILECEQNYFKYIIQLNLIAEALIKDGQHDVAEKFLLEAVDMGSESSKTYIMLIDLYKEFDKAKLDKFINEFSNSNADSNKYHVQKVMKYYNGL